MTIITGSTEDPAWYEHNIDDNNYNDELQTINYEYNYYDEFLDMTYICTESQDYHQQGCNQRRP